MDILGKYTRLVNLIIQTTIALVPCAAIAFKSISHFRS